jgi:hypothetical protein
MAAAYCSSAAVGACPVPTASTTGLPRESWRAMTKAAVDKGRQWLLCFPLWRDAGCSRGVPTMHSQNDLLCRWPEADPTHRTFLYHRQPLRLTPVPTRNAHPRPVQLDTTPSTAPTKLIPTPSRIRLFLRHTRPRRPQHGPWSTLALNPVPTSPRRPLLAPSASSFCRPGLLFSPSPFLLRVLSATTTPLPPSSWLPRRFPLFKTHTLITPVRTSTS